MSRLQVKVQARRRSCYGAREWSDVTVRLALREGPHGTILGVIEGAVTGFESFYLNGMTSWSAKWGTRNWIACGGTAGQWDTLLITPSEMDRALRALKVVPRSFINNCIAAGIVFEGKNEPTDEEGLCDAP